MVRKEFFHQIKFLQVERKALFNEKNNRNGFESKKYL